MKNGHFVLLVVTDQSQNDELHFLRKLSSGEATDSCRIKRIVTDCWTLTAVQCTFYTFRSAIGDRMQLSATFAQKSPAYADDCPLSGHLKCWAEWPFSVSISAPLDNNKSENERQRVGEQLSKRVSNFFYNLPPFWWQLKRTLRTVRRMLRLTRFSECTP